MNAAIVPESPEKFQRDFALSGYAAAHRGDPWAHRSATVEICGFAVGVEARPDDHRIYLQSRPVFSAFMQGSVTSPRSSEIAKHDEFAYCNTPPRFIPQSSSRRVHVDGQALDSDVVLAAWIVLI